MHHQFDKVVSSYSKAVNNLRREGKVNDGVAFDFMSVLGQNTVEMLAAVTLLNDNGSNKNKLQDVCDLTQEKTRPQNVVTTCNLVQTHIDNNPGRAQESLDGYLVKRSDGYCIQCK